MRIANLAGRAVLLVGDGAIDIHKASQGLFSPDPQALYDRWEEVRAWRTAAEPEPYQDTYLSPPVPAPRQVFAIGANYREHAAESDVDVAYPAPCPPALPNAPPS